ncbi:MAG: SCP2 sterol-binding domain-containing protein [Solirubrobacteraceae bacterium]|nr:MAG: acyl-CoA synthase [Solirubrobacterales bacterium]
MTESNATESHATESDAPAPPSADELAAMVANASDEQLAEAMASDGRSMILDEIFGRMADHFVAERAAGVNAVVHWKILDRPDGRYDHYELVIENGACSLSDVPSREPRVTLRVKPVDFIRLVTGSATGPALFMTGRLRIEGDLMFATRVATLFRVPSAG